MPAGTSAPGSASLDNPDSWWYRARSELMHEVLADHLRAHLSFVVDHCKQGELVELLRAARGRRGAVGGRP